MSFKSEAQGNIYRHIVLCVKFKDKLGCLGLSRRDDLMDKPMSFEVGVLLLCLGTQKSKGNCEYRASLI